MPIEQVQSRYQITDRHGFEKLIFTESSQKSLYLHYAVEFARERDSVLQNAREAAAFRISADDKDYANHHQLTRTVIAYVKELGKYYVAVDDSPDLEQNILLARPKELEDLFGTGRPLVSRRDTHVRRLLKNAEKSKRIFEITDRDMGIIIKNKSKDRAGNKAIFGDVAKPYVEWRLEKGSSGRGIYLHNPTTLESQFRIGKKAVIQVVGLGGDDFDGIGSVSGINLIISGYARGVREKK